MAESDEETTITINCSPKTFSMAENDEDFQQKLVKTATSGRKCGQVFLAPIGRVETFPPAKEVDIAKNIWLESATKYLIFQLKELTPHLGKKVSVSSKRKIYKLIADKMTKKCYCFSPAQVESKTQTVERRFKQCKVNNNKTGRSKMTCPYEDELEDLFKEKKSIVPEFSLNSEDVVLEVDCEDHDVDEYPPSTSVAAVARKRKRRRCLDDMYDLAEKYAKRRDERQEDENDSDIDS